MSGQDKLIAVGMSGGVDSSVAAALLCEQGHSVMGVTAVMNPEFSRCCSQEDIRRAQEVAAQLGIEHRVVDVQSAFENQIIRNFMEEYLAGRTPSPCVHCNPLIKFGAVHDIAREWGATEFATGHYVRVESTDNGVRLCRGRDRTKDQSYFLSRCSQEQLRTAVFPLGDMSKLQVGALAAERGLVSRASKESQELCFVDDVGHGTWIDVRSLATRGAGDITDLEGHVVGRHVGIHHYTVGQRRGLGVAMGEPVYVVRIEAAANRLVVGPRDSVMSRSLDAREVSWIQGVAPAEEFQAEIQIRYNHGGATGTVTVEGDAIHVDFDEPQFAVTPGQAVVMYDGEEVLGCAWIQ